MSRRSIHLKCALACFLSFVVAHSMPAQEQTPAALLNLLLSPDTSDGQWQTTFVLFQKLPPEMAIRTLFPEIANGIPGGMSYATYNCYLPEHDRHVGGWGKYCVTDWLWCKVLECGRSNPQVGKTLLELWAHPLSPYGQRVLLQAMDYGNWVPEAEEMVLATFRDSGADPPLRAMAAGCLLHHFGTKYHSEAVQFALYGPEKVREYVFNELESPPHARLTGIDPIVSRMGFAMLLAELAKSEEAYARGGVPRSRYGAFLYADHLGTYLGEKFTPDYKLPQYQGEAGREIWYWETVENALTWWSKNKDK
jgi:hypothetical protein